MTNSQPADFMRKTFAGPADMKAPGFWDDLKVIGGQKIIHQGISDDDTIDRWNRVHSVLLLTVSCLMITAYTLFGTPIICLNEGFAGAKAHGSYINTICWIKNTYYNALRDDIPSSLAERKEKEISYYQWVVLILMVQATLFYTPRFIWRFLRTMCGISLKDICNAAKTTRAQPSGKREGEMKKIAQHIHAYLSAHRPLRGRLEWWRNHIAKYSLFCICVGSRSGTRLFYSYIITKLLYCCNSIGQLWVLYYFLSNQDGPFLQGMNLLTNLFSNTAWEETGKFPRVAYCDFDIRILGNMVRHTIQCLLPVNLLNEKIYLLLWFWFFFISILNVGSLCVWLRLLHPATRRVKIRRYVKRHRFHDNPELEETPKKKKTEKVAWISKIKSCIGVETRPREASNLNGVIPSSMETSFGSNQSSATLRKQEKVKMSEIIDFADNYLRLDGYFIIEMVSLNTNDQLTYLLVKYLWLEYNAKKRREHHV